MTTDKLITTPVQDNNSSFFYFSNKLSVFLLNLTSCESFFQ